MKCFVIFVILFGLFCGGRAEDECPKNQKVIFCYYASWAVYRENEGYFSPEDIDPHGCTHLVYAFAGLDLSLSITSLDSVSDYNLGGFSKFISLKEKNPCLKTLLAIGGWTLGSRRFSLMASTAQSRVQFAESVLRFLITYDFDGIDVDWEYPTLRGGLAEDKENFGELLKELRNKLEKWNLLITTAVPLSATVFDEVYDLEAVSSYVDYVLIMAYDYTSVTSKTTGLLSPMFAIEDTVTAWRQVVPSEKLVVGVPAFARTFNLEDPSINGIGAPTNGTALLGDYLEAGTLTYFETIGLLLSNKYTLVQTEHQNYYAYYNTSWITFDLEDTYQAKAEYVLKENLGGIMIWSIDTDDTLALYNKTTFPIINTVRQVLYNLT